MKKLIILVSALIFSTGTVYAGPLTIVRGQDFPPYHFLDSAGKETGFIVEIINHVSRELNLEIRFAQYPWSRCLKMVETGEADAMMNLFKTRERMTFMYFTDNELTREVNQFFKLRTNPVTFTGNMNTLKRLRIGVIRNYSYGTKFDEFSPKLNILRLETEKALILNLVGQRCDVILGNDIVLKSLAAKLPGGENIISSGPGISDDPLYLGFSKARGHKELAEKFSRALQQFKGSKIHKRIIKKYLPQGLF